MLIDSNWQQRYLLLHPGDDELTTINGTMMQWEEAEYTGVPRTPSRPDHDVYVYDVNGRMMDRRLNAPDLIEFHLSSSGVYLVKVGNAPARRVVLIL